MRLFAAILVLAVAATVRADENHARECQSAFIEAVSSGGVDCDALSSFRDCLHVATSDLTEDQAGTYLSTLESAYASSDCDMGGSGDANYADSKDVIFFRAVHQRTGIFMLRDRINELTGRLDRMKGMYEGVFSARGDNTHSFSQQAAQAVAGSVSSQIDAEDTSRGALANALNAAESSANELASQQAAREAQVRQAFDAAFGQVTGVIETRGGAVQNQMNTLESSLLGDITSIRDDMATEQARQEAQYNSINSDLEELANGANDVINELEDVAGWQPPIIWSGGCRHHGHGGGWSTYCFNGNDRADQFPTALYNDYIEPRGGDIRFRQEGYYNLNWWAIQHGCGSYNVQFESSWNGGHRNIGYAHRDSKPGGWFSNFMDQTWAFKEGDRFWMTVHGGWCNPYRWHSWNHNGDHSRMQVTYMGPLRS